MTTPTLQPYTTYQDSETAWLGEVPAHWEKKRLKDSANVNPVSRLPQGWSESDLVEFVPMTNVDEELGRIKKYDMVPLSEVASGYKRFKNGDVIFAKITPCMENGNCAVVSGLSRNIGFGSTEFLVYRPYKRLIPEFLHYFLHNEAFRLNAEPFMKGSAGQKRVPGHYVSTHQLPVPPLAEQQAIVDLLDRKSTEIDRMIGLLTRKAEEYTQLKQSLIDETVTRGLDKAVPMKYSGVEWLGEIPAHWEVGRLKDVVRAQFSNVDKLSNENEIPVKLCNYNEVYNNEYIDASLPFMEATATSTEITRFSLRADDVLVTKDSESADDIAVPSLVLESLPNVVCGYHLAQFRCKKRYMHGPYLFRLFQSKCFGSRFIIYAKGITRVGLSISAFYDASTPLPPLPDQRRIAQYLDEKSHRIDRIVTIINTKIEKLRELRQALVNEIVTGKVRVA